jgi:hypothetical protein
MDFDRYRHDKAAFLAEIQLNNQALPQRPPSALTHARDGLVACCECSLEYAAKLGRCPKCRHGKCWLCQEVYRGNDGLPQLGLTRKAVPRKPVPQQVLTQKPLPPKPLPQRPARALATAGKTTSCCECSLSYSARMNVCPNPGCRHRKCRLCYDVVSYGVSPLC